ncbi:serine hydrolase domain-containing protein [Iningainema tapete]|uniref:Beta-lactamase family protein n=1 Tax=Iningainema tapete BLCC-T55 TaxID=2748662 RepID=A0A8J7C6V0_9CYAN|nr:serine hydrolase domain-containing protein [Iningainema tapete]MBD2774809.1 beta-lactamase family protein [Iningainema tapete BLCC-T55]
MRFLYQTTASLTIAATVFIGMAGSAEAASLTPTSSIYNAVSSTNTVSDDLASKLQATLDKTVKDNGITGAAVAITTPQTTWFGASGVSNLETGTAMRKEDRFPIASTTKPFTAAVVLKLAEEGKLSLEDTLDKWLPSSIVDNITDGRNITIRQLLNGTSGIYDIAWSFEGKESPLQQDIRSNPTKQWAKEELVAYAYGKPRFATELQGISCTPTYCYPNTGMILAGMIIEKATGSTYAEVLRSRILDPLGLSNTFFAPQEQIPGGYVNGYLDYDDNGTLDDVTAVNLSSASTAGGIVSNTQDLTRFAQALFGGELLSSDSLQQMLDFQGSGDDSFEYGLGLTSREFQDIGRAWGHRGDFVGHGSQWWYFPDLGITFVSLQNSPSEKDILSPMLETLRTQGQHSNLKEIPEPSAMTGLMMGVVGFLTLRFRSASLNTAQSSIVPRHEK